MNRSKLRTVFGVIAVAVVSLAVSPAPGPPTATLDALFPSGRLTLPLEDLAAKYPLAPGKDFQVSEVGRDTHSSQHAVWIVDREVPHRHDTHDLIVVMVAGYGTMRLGAETRPVGTGSILYVPRGTAHAFTNESGAPALAYAVYFPPFDGKDRVTVEP